MVIALEILQQHWLWAMLAGGVLLSWMVYLAHYGAPESARAEADRQPDGGTPVDMHEFAEGLRETDLPVPPVLKLFFLMMFLFAVGYVAWIRYAIGSY
ncbi:MAG: hypothetical protein GX774_01435 [Armatimonadetes bacterium]|jgi:hypothetical protein|nr:hypothetical protein [Armatimonadota bacterium]